MITRNLVLTSRKKRLLQICSAALCFIGALCPTYTASAQVRRTGEGIVSSNGRDLVVSNIQSLERKIVELYEMGADYEAEGKYSAARSVYEEIFALFKTENIEHLKAIADRTPALGAAVMSLVEIYWAERMPEKAAAVYGTLIPLQVNGEGVLGNIGTREEHDSLAVSYSEERTGELITESIHSTNEDHALIRRAFSTALVKKSRVLDAIGLTAISTSENISPQIQSELNTLYRELADLRLATSSAQSVRTKNPSVTALEDKITKINLELLRRDRDVLEWLILPPANTDILEKARRNVPANSALIEIVEYIDPNSNNRRYAAYVLTAQSINVVDIGDAAKINSQAAVFRQVLQTKSARAKTIGRQLDEQIMQPVRSLLKDQIGERDIEHLLISPDSYLNTIPFEALVDETDSYLIESYQMSYVASGKDIIRFADTRASIQRNAHRLPFVVIADPDYDTSSLREEENAERAIATAVTNRRSVDFETLSFIDLPGTLQEANLLKNLIPRAIFLTQDEPTENIVKQIQSPFILHFATHGFFLSDKLERESNTNNRNASFDLISTEGTSQVDLSGVESPLLRAGLALTGANNPGEEGEDGILTALEVSEMDLRDTELVVLSACETGLGAVSSGEGIYGMRRAFTMAGAASQVLSLWQVDDTGTSELMSLFYENLIQKRQGRSEALRNAQIALLSTGTYQHPYYWSSFILSGNWRPLMIEDELGPDLQIAPDHRARITTENFNLDRQIEEYKEVRAWRDQMLAEMLELEDQRRYEELAEKRKAFNQVMDSRTDPDLFRVSITLVENLKERREDLHLQQRYADAIEVAKKTIEILESGTEEMGRYDLLISWQALAFLQQAQGADDITMLMTYKQILSIDRDLRR